MESLERNTSFFIFSAYVTTPIQGPITGSLNGIDSKCGQTTHKLYQAAYCNFICSNFTQNVHEECSEKHELCISIGRRRVNNLRHADITTRIAKSEEKLEPNLEAVKEEKEKARLYLNKTKKKSNVYRKLG